MDTHLGMCFSASSRLGTTLTGIDGYGRSLSIAVPEDIARTVGERLSYVSTVQLSNRHIPRTIRGEWRIEP